MSDPTTYGDQRMSDQSTPKGEVFFIGMVFGILIGMFSFVFLDYVFGSLRIARQANGYVIEDGYSGASYVSTSDEQSCEIFLKVLEGVE